MIFHELKDLAAIYGDYNWDKANVRVWQPDEQREMELTFTGSSKGDDGIGKSIHFNATYTDELGGNCVFDAFDDVLGEIINSGYDMSLDWKKRYLELILEKRKQKRNE